MIDLINMCKYLLNIEVSTKKEWDELFTRAVKRWNDNRTPEDREEYTLKYYWATEALCIEKETEEKEIIKTRTLNNDRGLEEDDE